MTAVPVVIGALGAVSDMFDKHMEKLSTTIRLEVIQKTALLGTARLLRNVLSLYGIRRGFPWDLQELAVSRSQGQEHLLSL